MTASDADGGLPRQGVMRLGFAALEVLGLRVNSPT